METQTATVDLPMMKRPTAFDCVPPQSAEVVVLADRMMNIMDDICTVGTKSKYIVNEKDTRQVSEGAEVRNGELVLIFVNNIIDAPYGTTSEFFARCIDAVAKHHQLSQVAMPVVEPIEAKPMIPYLILDDYPEETPTPVVANPVDKNDKKKSIVFMFHVHERNTEFGQIFATRRYDVQSNAVFPDLMCMKAD